MTTNTIGNTPSRHYFCVTVEFSPTTPAANKKVFNLLVGKGTKPTPGRGYTGRRTNTIPQETSKMYFKEFTTSVQEALGSIEKDLADAKKVVKDSHPTIDMTVCIGKIYQREHIEDLNDFWQGVDNQAIANLSDEETTIERLQRENSDLTRRLIEIHDLSELRKPFENMSLNQQVLLKPFENMSLNQQVSPVNQQVIIGTPDVTRDAEIAQGHLLDEEHKDEEHKDEEHNGPKEQ